MRHAVLATALFAVFTQAAFAAAAPTPSPPLSDTEKAFVTKSSATLDAKYPTTETAKAAGFQMLFDTIGSDNTYDWTNMSFANVAPASPNFLWYDRHGHLVGVDWEFPKGASTAPPQLDAFPVKAARWVAIPEHVHYAYTINGKLKYGASKATPAMRTGTLTAPVLRANGVKLPANAKLVWAMYHPAVWDLAMWTVPNPSGAFADKNPNVK